MFLTSVGAAREHEGLRLPDGRNANDLRRSELLRELQAIGCPGIEVWHTKMELLEAYSRIAAYAASHEHFEKLENAKKTSKKSK